MSIIFGRSVSYIHYQIFTMKNRKFNAKIVEGVCKSKHLFFLFTLIICSSSAFSQQVLIKNNLLYNLTATPNLGIETSLSDRMTLELTGGYNPFTFSNNKKFKHWLLQSEARYWFGNDLDKFFLGAHFYGGEFNMGNISPLIDIFSNLKDYRYQGSYIGGGLSGGHRWKFNEKWSIDMNLGIGLVYSDFDKYGGEKCALWIESGKKTYFGLTKMGVSVAYTLKNKK